MDNAKDLERARAAGLAAPMVDRLQLTPKVIETCAQGCEQLAAMPDLIGEILGMKQQPSGIRVGQMRVPIGVFGMILESLPNVTIEAAGLCIKSVNACILRGGSEAIESNRALARLVQQALLESGLPAHAVQLVQTTDREVVGQLITMPQYVDVIIPRGGKGRIERISRDATVPVINHAVRLDLPQASAQRSTDTPETIRIAVDAQGAWHWNDTPVADDALPGRLAAVAALDPQPELHIRGDRGVRYERVAQVMAHAQAAGLRRIAFVTDPGNSSPP